jgi:hypothetical protein
VHNRLGRKGGNVHVNQDQVKEALLSVEPNVGYFTVVFSGKTSKKVHGLYKPESREIVIHNRNFATENALMYTAIHEFAHHVHAERSPVPISSRSHTTEYWSILHELLARAEGLGLYRNLFETLDEFTELTRRIREHYLAGNGRLMKEFGALLVRAAELCEKHEMSFDDYVDRQLGLHRTAARSVVKMHTLDLPPEIGYENMRTLASVSDDAKREQAREAFLAGKSPDTVKAFLGPAGRPVTEPLEELRREKRRIQRMIGSLSRKLAEIEKRMEELDTVE